MNDLQSTFLILSASLFSILLFRDNFENRRFFIVAWGFMFVLLFIHEKENWQFFPRLLSRHFPPCFDHVL